MDFIVLKIGALMFDTLHAYGLAILLAFMAHKGVHVVDEGHYFRLKSREIAERCDVEECLRSLLKVPNEDELRRYQESPETASVNVMILDGLLAVLFTSPGIRTVSVPDMFDKERVSPAAIEQSLAKVTSAIERWIKLTVRTARRQSDWIDHLLTGYIAKQPTMPLPIVGSTRSINILMTIEAILSYSTRRPISDGRIADRNNITIIGTPYAPLLTIIAAAFMLHAHRVAEKFIIFYLPIAKSVTLSSDIVLPPLRASAHPIAQTLTREWLQRSWSRAFPRAHWSGLGYQIVQTQGAQQSISLSRGCLDYAWIQAIERNVGVGAVERWCQLLRIDQREISLELDNLSDFLLHRDVPSWEAHLLEFAWHAYAEGSITRNLYRLSEVREITKAMLPQETTSLRVILDREQGTRKFGYALRQLGRHNRALVRDLIDELNGVRDHISLLRVLHRAVEECWLASAKSPFMRIPDDDDLRYLLDDIEQYGVQTVASLLIILSSLYYRVAGDSNQDEG